MGVCVASSSRRNRPTDDLISALVQVQDEGDRLTEDELIGTCVLLLNAGHEASVNGAANSWWALFRHPDALARLRSEPGLVGRPEAGEVQEHRPRQLRDDTLELRHHVGVQAPVDRHDLTSAVSPRADPERHGLVRVARRVPRG